MSVNSVVPTVGAATGAATLAATLAAAETYHLSRIHDKQHHRLEALAEGTGHCKCTQLTGHVLLHVGSNNSVVRASSANCSELNSSFGRQFLGQW